MMSLFALIGIAVLVIGVIVIAGVCLLGYHLYQKKENEKGEK